MWTRQWIRPSADALYELQDRLGEPIEVVEYEEPFDSGSLHHQVHVPVERRWPGLVVGGDSAAEGDPGANRESLEDGVEEVATDWSTKTSTPFGHHPSSREPPSSVW